MPRIRMTLDGSLQRRSVTCRYYSMPSPTLSLMHSTCGSRYNEREKNHPVGSDSAAATHRHSLQNEDLLFPFCFPFLPSLSPPFFIFPLPCPFFFLRTMVNGSSWVDFGGDVSLRQNSKGDGGDSAGRLQHVALCHFFIHS